MTQWSIRKVDTQSEWSTHSNQNGSSELYHYGVKGMKWGVIRTPEQLGHTTTSSSSGSSSARRPMKINYGEGVHDVPFTRYSGGAGPSGGSGVLNIEKTDWKKDDLEGSMTGEELSKILQEKASKKEEFLKLVQKGKETVQNALKKVSDLAKDVGQKAKSAVNGLVQSGKAWLEKTLNIKQTPTKTVDLDELKKSKTNERSITISPGARTVTATGNYPLKELQKKTSGLGKDWKYKQK